MALRAGLIALALLGLFGAARAEENPRPLRQDSRIRTVTYQHDNVVVVNGALGVSTMIMFGDDETIDTVAIGDSVAWQAVPDEFEAHPVHQADRTRSRHEYECRHDQASL